MLLLYLSYADPINTPDLETLYYPSETNQGDQEYLMLGSGSSYEFRASERTTDAEYRVLPSRR